MRIVNGTVFLEEGVFRQGDLVIQGEYIASFHSSPEHCPGAEEEVLDASGCLVLPGLVDIHLHGCGNRDFSDGEVNALAEIAKREASWGITSLCGAAMTLPESRLLKAAEAVKEYQESFRQREPRRYRACIWKAPSSPPPGRDPRKKKISGFRIPGWWPGCRRPPGAGCGS